MKRGIIYIGTSGWHYAHWVGPFYPEHMPSGEFLSYYTSHFETVEINNTFYHLPSIQTLQDWRAGTPKDFLFACKGSRFISHMKKLKDPRPSIKRFFQTIEVLGKKLGPILFQLPPRWRINMTRLDDFLKVLPKKYCFAFEFRDESWFDQTIFDLLAKNNAGFCLYNLAGRWSPEVVTADFVYIRLHGPDGPYQGEYDGKILRTWAKKCVKWSSEGKDVYCYFDNDQKGYAVKNAMKLKQMTGKLVADW
jgi:uncharacterized protein YecE (DUF72 family)